MKWRGQKMTVRSTTVGPSSRASSLGKKAPERVERFTGNLGQVFQMASDGIGNGIVHFLRNAILEAWNQVHASIIHIDSVVNEFCRSIGSPSAGDEAFLQELVLRREFGYSLRTWSRVIKWISQGKAAHHNGRVSCIESFVRREHKSSEI